MEKKEKEQNKGGEVLLRQKKNVAKNKMVKFLKRKDNKKKLCKAVM